MDEIELVMQQLVAPDGFKIELRELERRELNFGTGEWEYKNLDLVWKQDNRYRMKIYWINRDIDEINRDIRFDAKDILNSTINGVEVEEVETGFNASDPWPIVSHHDRGYFLTDNTDLIRKDDWSSWKWYGVLINVKDNTLSIVDWFGEHKGKETYAGYRYIPNRDHTFTITKEELEQGIKDKEIFLYTRKKEGE